MHFCCVCVCVHMTDWFLSLLLLQAIVRHLDSQPDGYILTPMGNRLTVRWVKPITTTL